MTSKARILLDKLCRSILDQEGTIMYMDTDSVMYLTSKMNKVIVPINKYCLGYLKREYDYDKERISAFYGLSAKVYGIEKSSEFQF